MITEKEFRQLLNKTTIKRYKSVDGCWALSAIYPLSLAEPNKMRSYSYYGMPKVSWARSKTLITRRLYEELAHSWGFYGDVTPFIK